MAIRRTLVAGITGSAAAAAAIAADPPTQLAPTSKWQMDYAPTECRLLRTFGEGKSKTTLQLSRLDVSDVLEMALAAQHVPVTDGDVPVSVSTSTVAQVPGMQARGFAAAGKFPGSIRFRPDKDLPGALRSDVAAGLSTKLGVRFARRYAVQLDMGSMKGALTALDKCMDNLIASWGLDPAEQQQRKSAPEPLVDPAKWFRPSDYPAALDRSGAGGIVVLRLIVAADGSIQDRAVAKSGGDKAFEDLTCELTKARAQFRPAIGAGGQPIKSVWINRIHWQPAMPFVIKRN
ncbi:TonB family protein [Sphingomonas rubra]|uniref:TonB family C-terminal domain-containing protein n=1 Tax=Sphingomonas rubra TaxID=634430 RepID=A0A1I5QPI1_9SPHN|nr:TonB family protein [Sphingomonas rubra]SFP48179.1 TonB family C-terminal domain-containing protein [Sphingomonas rubra]